MRVHRTENTMKKPKKKKKQQLNTNIIIISVSLYSKPVVHHQRFA